MKLVAWLGFPLTVAFAGCQTVQTTQGGVVGVERKQSMSSLISASQIDQSAVEAYGKVLADAGKKNQLNRDSAQVARVHGVANRLIPNTAAFRADAPGWKWEVNVITSDEVNAWCMPGGKIAVYTGLLTKLNPTDDELAAVMGTRSRTRCASTGGSARASRWPSSSGSACSALRSGSAIWALN